MRVQAGDGDARRGNAEARQLARRQRDRLLERLARQHARNIGERHVHRREHDAKRVGVEHHRDVPHAGEVCKQIGVAGPGQTGQAKRFLVHRRGRDCVDLALFRVADRAHDRLVCGAARIGAQHAGRKAGGIRWRIQQRLAGIEDT